MRKQIEEKLLGKHAATMDWNGSKEDGITQDKFHSLLNKASKPIKKEEPKSD